MQTSTKVPRILFFVDGPTPSLRDLAVAAAIGANVVFRNAQAVPGDAHSLEICDGVAGEVIPPLYAEAYPTAEDAVENYKAYLAELSAKVGDEAAPVRKAVKEPTIKQPTKTAPAGGAWKANA